MPVATGAKRKRGEGQWALGYREPLNKNEENKRNDDGLNVRQRIIDVYSKYGFDSIDPADLRGRFRWYGLYTQRRPGIDGGKTAVLEPEELDDRYFMLRVRIDGGQLSNDQLRVIADISRRYARGTADVTDRQNIQLHWIEIENVPDIWEALESVGLSTTEACGDTPRVILGCPLAGIDADEIIDGTAEIAAITSQYIGDAAFSNLPRKFKSSISGCAAQCAIHEINDIAFVGVVQRPGRGRLRPVGRRRPVHQPDDRQAARRLRPAGSGRRGLGGRDRALPRLRLPPAAAPGQDQVPGRGLGPGEVPRGPGEGVPRLRAGRRPGPGCPPRRDPRPRGRPRRSRTGTTTSASRPPWAACRPTRSTSSPTWPPGTVAAGCTRPPSRRWSSSTYRRSGPGSLVAELDQAGLPAVPSAFRRHTMACTGIEFCKLAIVETKARAADLISELERRLPGFDVPVTINVNGCPNSCARIQTADIGLKGSLVTGPDGQQVEGFQIHLGGSLNGGDGTGSGFGRKVRGLKATAEELPDYVERVLRRFDAAREPGESFAAWTRPGQR